MYNRTTSVIYCQIKKTNLYWVDPQFPQKFQVINLKAKELPVNIARKSRISNAYYN